MCNVKLLKVQGALLHMCLMQCIAAAAVHQSIHSFWVSCYCQESRPLQQMLLEEQTTQTRLERVKEILGTTLKFYSAATALDSVFRSSSDGETGSTGGEAAQPPPGGPD